MKVTRKDATIETVGSDEDFPGRFRVILSAPTKDRDGDTLAPEDWKQPLPDHITFDVDHGMSVASTVGSGTPAIEADTGNLIVDGTYSSLPRAQEVRTLVREGHIKTTSVAFMTIPAPASKGVGKTVRELLNGAFVAVPSNREAVVLESKSADRKAGARNSATDLERIQQIHDLTVLLGADPNADADPDEDTKSKAWRTREVKSVAGSLEALQDRLRDALQDLYPNSWLWLRATVPTGDGEGYCVFDIEDPDTYDGETYRQSYTDDGTVATISGDREPVDLTEVVTPDPDDASDDTSGTAPAPAAEAAASAAGAKAAPNAEELAEMQVRAAQIRVLAMNTNPEEGS